MKIRQYKKCYMSVRKDICTCVNIFVLLHIFKFMYKFIFLSVRDYKGTPILLVLYIINNRLLIDLIPSGPINLNTYVMYIVR